MWPSSPAGSTPPLPSMSCGPCASSRRAIASGPRQFLPTSHPKTACCLAHLRPDRILCELGVLCVDRCFADRNTSTKTRKDEEEHLFSCLLLSWLHSIAG